MATHGGALVTGAARGLGLAVARALVRRGHAVHLTDVDEAAASEAAHALGESACTGRRARLPHV
jgi:NAD(P)-dependent dehydrogenase (short-subunit alcohol dehydrogenase family)